MPAELPLEIVSLIAQFVAQAGHRQGTRKLKVHTSLVPFSLVNTIWQAAFEARISSDLTILSPSNTRNIIVGHESPQPKHGITLEQLKAITTGPEQWKAARRKALRRMLYRVAVPHLLDWRNKGKTADFSYRNTYRQENDAAFEVGMKALFSFLPQWASDHRFDLSIALQAENVYTSDQDIEPNTFITGNRRFTAYVADLHPSCCLPPVSCIAGLDVTKFALPAAMGRENGISIHAALMISRACVGNALQVCHLRDQSSIPRTESKHGPENRRITAESLPSLPKGVRSLHVDWFEWSEIGYLPDAESEDSDCGESRTIVDPLKVMVRSDCFSAALRDVAKQLDDLHTEGLAVTPDFFWSRSFDNEAGARWLGLETLQLENVPFVLPTAEPLRYYLNEDENGPMSPPSDGVWRHPYLPARSGDISIIFSYFDVLFEAIGKVAEYMPLLQKLTVSVGARGNGKEHGLEVSMRSGKRVLAFESKYGYSPSMSVIKAWKLSDKKLVLNRSRLEIEYTAWPPCEQSRNSTRRVIF